MRKNNEKGSTFGLAWASQPVLLLWFFFLNKIYSRFGCRHSHRRRHHRRPFDNRMNLTIILKFVIQLLFFSPFFWFDSIYLFFRFELPKLEWTAKSSLAGEFTSGSLVLRAQHLKKSRFNVYIVMLAAIFNLLLLFLLLVSFCFVCWWFLKWILFGFITVILCTFFSSSFTDSKNDWIIFQLDVCYTMETIIFLSFLSMQCCSIVIFGRFSIEILSFKFV